MASILQTIVQKKHYRFVDRVDSWQEGVRQSALSLVEDGSVDELYYIQMIRCIEEYGPYMVFEHEVVMPHTQQYVQGVHKTGIGFMRVREPVDFGQDEEGERKQARLFFTLAACNPEEHLDNIGQLMEIFCNEALLDALLKANTPEDLLCAEQQFMH